MKLNGEKKNWQDLTDGFQFSFFIAITISASVHS